MKILIKPLSINKAFQGRRWKTLECNDWENEVWLSLPKKIVLPEGKLELHYTFGLSNKNSDLGNCEKLLTDILCKKYNFNDKNIYKFILQRKDVKKGEEFISFEFNSFIE